MSIRAIYKDGVFKPLENVSVKEGTEVDVYPREERENGKKPKSVFDLKFFGMWKNRDDIGTGVEYVNRIRKYRREPEGQ
jgi:predicted DNA-binding antitoxin AbrB/MazE fold protein